jgi:tyrosine-protein phosphatase SIW14
MRALLALTVSHGMFLRGTHWLLPMTIGGLLAILGTYATVGPKGPIKHRVLPVEQGVLYRSPQLSAEQLAEEIRRRGIKTVVNLGSEADTDEPVCRELGVNYVECPIGDVWRLCGLKGPRDGEVPSAPYDLTPLWKLIDDPASRPVLIHCRAGVHRTGAIAAMYRIRRQGWRANDAITEMDLFGFDSRKAKFDSVAAYLRALEDATRQAQMAGQMQRR